MAPLPRLWRYPFVYASELRAPDGRARIPEPMVMDEDVAVEGFDEASEDASALVAVYETSARAVHRLLPQGGQVVDLGCGPGEFARYLAERRPDCRVLGLDLSEPMVERARARIARAGLAARVSFEQADATDVSLEVLPPDVSVVTSLNLLHQFPDVETLDRCLAAIAGLRERFRCAIWLLDLVRFRDARTMARMLGMFEPDMGEAARKNTLESEAAGFTVDELRERLAAAGLGDLESRTGTGLSPWQSHSTRPTGAVDGAADLWSGRSLPPEVRVQTVLGRSLLPRK